MEKLLIVFHVQHIHVKVRVEMLGLGLFVIFVGFLIFFVFFEVFIVVGILVLIEKFL